MLCFRCGSEVAEGETCCSNCGQQLVQKKSFNLAPVPIRAIERRQRITQEVANNAPFAIGEVLVGRYCLRELLGTGPFGAVYRAFDQEIEQDLALKVIYPALCPTPESRTAFVEGVHQVRKLSEQHIVRVYDAEIDGDFCFYTTQMLDGLSLKKLKALRPGGRFKLRELEPIFNQIAHALAHAHRTMVHGDLKAENVIVMPDVLKVTDFGLHQIVSKEQFETVMKQSGGSTVAPELRDAGTISAQSDIYSLGALLYELVCGQAFSATAPKPSEVLDDPQEAQPGGLDDIIAKATAENASERHESALSFAEALATLIDTRELLTEPSENLIPEDVTNKFVLPAASSLSSEDSPNTSDAKASKNAVQAAPIPVPVPQPVQIPQVSHSSLVPPPIQNSQSQRVSHQSVSQRMPMPGPVVQGMPVRPNTITNSKVSQPAIRGTGSQASIRTLPPTFEATEPSLRTVPLQSSAPWFLRSNAGFAASLLLVVAVIGVATWFVLDMLTTPEPVAPARPAVPITVKTVEVVEIENENSIQLQAPDSEQIVQNHPEPEMPAQSPEPVAEQKPAKSPEAVSKSASAPALAVAVKPSENKAESLKTVDKPAETPKSETSKVAAKPAEASKQQPTPEISKVESSKPESPKVAEKPAETPKAEAPVAAPQVEVSDGPFKVFSGGNPVVLAKAEETPKAAKASEPPTIKEEPKPVADGGLACPAGMRLMTTASFPAGTIRNERIYDDGIELAKQGKAFCIDIYEYPGRGQAPRVSVSADAAEKLCAAQGKRLCESREWLRGCRGKMGANYPYGKDFDEQKCNTGISSGTRNLASAGNFSGCKSASGLYDMSGNVAEWTADFFVRGGNFTTSGADSACYSAVRQMPGFSSNSTGFRCCSDFKM